MDTTPLSCREAMSMEKPIIATSVGGIPEMIYDDKTGFLVKEGDHQTWIKKIEILIEQKELSLRLGKNAKQLVIEKFNWEKLSIEFLNAVKPYLK